MVCHCLLLETSAGLVLIDTGLGLGDVRHPERITRLFHTFLRPSLLETETAVRQLGQLGHAPADVRHIVLTHLDFDHAGGLADFPRAKVHVMEREHHVAMTDRGLKMRMRYVQAQWAHGPDWVVHSPSAGEPWKGFSAVRAIDGLADEVLLVPLPGHSPGHAAIAVRTADGWLLHAGDAFFHRRAMQGPAHVPRLHRAFADVVDWDRNLRADNTERLRALANDPTAAVRVFCAHDPRQLEELQTTAAR